jgi:hypothetical protein
MAGRARKIRRELLVGRTSREICANLGRTTDEYRSATRWLSHAWKNNGRAFGDYAAGEQCRLESIEEQIEKLEADTTVARNEKGKSFALLSKLAHEVRTDIWKMGLALGVLQRDETPINDKGAAEVRFGDERAFWNKPALPAAPVIDVAAGTVN